MNNAGLNSAGLNAGELLDRLRAAPVVDLDAVLPGRFMVVAPHPDDETLGCGGMIAEACARGRPPVVVILTDGGFSHPGSVQYPRERLVAVREREAAEAVALLGLPPENLHFLRAADGAAPASGPDADRLVAALATLANGCDTVLVSWRHDPHCDHGAACALALQTAQIGGKRVLEYPVWGWTLARDTALLDVPAKAWRVKVSRHLAAKGRAVAAHASQHAGLITDDPAGFVLPPSFLALFETPFETVLESAGLETTGLESAA